MKMLFSSRGLFVLGFVLLVAANSIVLFGVTANRSGEPDSQILLTERELPIQYRMSMDNSGLALRLAWRTLPQKKYSTGYSYRGAPAWFDADKLEELGFDLSSSTDADGNRAYYKQPIAKEVFIVLESNGEPYRKAVKRAEAALERAEKIYGATPGDKKLRDNLKRAKKRLQREHTEKSRLFAVDAGLDAGSLRAQYQARERYIITKALVKPRLRSAATRKEVFGFITRLSVVSINVQRQHRRMFNSVAGRNSSGNDGARAPRYKVRLAYGNRFEPWILTVGPMDDTSI